MQKFLEDTIESRFIKALLYNTQLPTLSTVNNNDYIVKDFVYIYKKDLIKCTKSGYLWDMLYEDTAEFDIIDNYEFGDYYPKFTRNYISINNYYDEDTHKALGHYLRCYRDIYDIDLMPFYNCYGGKYSSEFYLSIQEGIVARSNINYKVLIVPIKFNKTYTIAIDSPSKIILSAGFIRNADTVTVNEESITNLLYENFINCTTSYPNSNFLSPITYGLNLADVEDDSIRQQLRRYESSLCLLVQIPYYNNSSAVVLEGDYTNVASRKIFDISALGTLSGGQQNKLFLSRLSLLKFNDHTIHPFSDRLIEFLLNNVIDSNETITKNIERIQKYVNYTDYFSPESAVFDVWDPKLRKLVYDAYYKKGANLYDVTGFVDKDVEKMLLRIKSTER